MTSRDKEQVVLKDGRAIQIREPDDPQAVADKQSRLAPLEFWNSDNTYLGTVDLIMQPGAGWSGFCRTLIDLGIEVNVVSSDNYYKILDLIQPLGIRLETHLHGHFDSNDRLELVREIQKKVKMWLTSDMCSAICLHSLKPMYRPASK